MSICSTIQLNLKYSHFEATQKQMMLDINLIYVHLILQKLIDMKIRCKHNNPKITQRNVIVVRVLKYSHNCVNVVKLLLFVD